MDPSPTTKRRSCVGTKDDSDNDDAKEEAAAIQRQRLEREEEAEVPLFAVWRIDWTEHRFDSVE